MAAHRVRAPRTHSSIVVVDKELTVNNAVLKASGSDVGRHYARSTRQTQRTTVVGLVGTEWTLFTRSQTVHGVGTWSACHCKHTLYSQNISYIS